MTNNKLIPIEQRNIVFYDDEITVVLVEIDNQQIAYVPLKPICDYLGVDWAGQFQRIQRDSILSEEVSGIVVTPTPLSSKFANPQEMLCLPLDFLNGWLFGINANRVKPEIRDRVLRYQKECYRILADAFLQTSTNTEDWMTTSPETRAALIQIRETGRAVMQMAEEQLRIMQRLDQAAAVVGQHNRRILALEQKLAPREAITDEQASDIAEKVRAIAMALTEKDNSKNHFQAIFGELHRRYRVTSYKNIRQNQYQEVLDFLDEWLESQQQTGHS